MTPLPQGVRAKLLVYLVSAAGDEIELAIGNLKMLPGEIHPVDASASTSPTATGAR